MPLGFGAFSQIAAENTQVVVRVSVAGIVVQGVRETRPGLVRLAKRLPHIAQIIVRIDMIRLERDRAFIACGRVLKPPSAFSTTAKL